MSVVLHHVSLVITDPERFAAFYQFIFALERLDRPPFKIEGVWLGCGPSLQIQLTKHLPRNFRTKGAWTTMMSTSPFVPTTSRAF